MNATPTTDSLGLITTSPSPTSIPQLPDVDVDDDNCRLLGPFALVVQALMGVLVVGTLIWKRQREKPRRPWKIWMLDITKQMLGQLFVHTLNVLLSNVAANIGEQNPCSLYFLNILIDTTLGVFIIYLTLRISTHLLTDKWGLKGFVSGQYTDRPRKGASNNNNNNINSNTRLKSSSRKPKLSFWFKQLTMYFFALLVMKVIVTILFLIFPFLFEFGAWLLDFFGESKNVQVLFVMCLFPLAMNTLQFWLVDSFLRHNPTKSKYSQERSNNTTPGSSGLPAWDLSEQQQQQQRSSREYNEHSGLVDEEEDDDDEEDEEEQSNDHHHAQHTNKQLDLHHNQQIEGHTLLRSRTSSPASQHSYPPPSEPSIGIVIDEANNNAKGS
ncbi:unnamed protein product [Sympodiomycopsis kandeliae]